MCGFVTETPVHVVPGTNLSLKASLLRMEKRLVSSGKHVLIHRRTMRVHVSRILLHWHAHEQRHSGSYAHICTYRRRYTRSHCTTCRPTSASLRAPRPSPRKLGCTRNPSRANRARLLLLAHLAHTSRRATDSTGQCDCCWLLLHEPGGNSSTGW